MECHGRCKEDARSVVAGRGCSREAVAQGKTPANCEYARAAWGKQIRAQTHQSSAPDRAVRYAVIQLDRLAGFHPPSWRARVRAQRWAFCLPLQPPQLLLRDCPRLRRHQLTHATSAPTEYRFCRCIALRFRFPPCADLGQTPHHANTGSKFSRRILCFSDDRDQEAPHCGRRRRRDFPADLVCHPHPVGE